MSNSADGLELPPEIVAALTWDLPTLKAGSPEAVAFAKAFEPQQAQSERGEGMSDRALWQAARGVMSERAGEHDHASDYFEALANRDSPDRLLGLMLQAWSTGSTGPQVLLDASTLIRDLADPILRSRLLAKLAVSALDKGWAEIYASLHMEAFESAPRETALRNGLWAEALNNGLLTQIDSSEMIGAPNDPLVSLKWVSDLALTAASDALEDGFEAQIESTWSWTIKTGQTPLDAMVAAETQASWAGATSMRRWIRKQLGAYLLAGAANGSRQWAYGLVMWAAGAGRQKIRNAFDQAEPHLDAISVDLVIDELRRNVETNARQCFLEMVHVAWDEISDPMLSMLFAEIPIELAQHREFEITQRIWACLLWRNPKLWSENYVALDAEQQRSLVPHLMPAATHGLPETVRDSLLSRTLELLATEPGQPSAYLLALDLASHSESTDLVAEVVDLVTPASAVPDVVELYPDVLTGSELVDAQIRLTEHIEKQNDDARHGKFGLGGSSPRIELARIAATAGVPASETEELLIASAAPDLAAELQVEALQGLAILGRAGKLSDKAIDAIRSMADGSGPFGGFGHVSPTLVRTVRLLALSPGLHRQERAELVALCRNEDPKVRLFAIRVAFQCLVETSDESLTWAVISGLFDPNEDVTQRALGAIDQARLASVESAFEVVTNRVLQLFDGTGRDTRAEAVRAARRLAKLGEDTPQFDALIERATADRSWQVRRAAVADDEI